MRRHTIIFAAAALSLWACSQDELEPTIRVPEEIDAGSSIDVPGIRVIDVHTDGFTADWDAVSDALCYEYSFNGGEFETTEKTRLEFSGLEKDTEYILKLRALPRPESGRLASAYVTVNVLTSEIQELDMPLLAIGNASTSISIISWGAVPGAVNYLWELGELSGSTTKTFITFEGLLEGREYTLKVKAVCNSADTEKKDSPWAEIAFKPVNDGSGDLFFSNFATTCDGISFDVYANAGQYWWYEIVPKTAYSKYESHQAYLDAVKASITSKASALVAEGKTSEEAYSLVLKSGSAAVKAGACASLTYMLTVFGMDLSGNIITDAKPREITTPAEISDDLPHYIDEGDWFRQTLGLGSTTNYPPTTTLSFQRYGTDVSEINYKLYTTSNFTKKFGEELDSEAISKVKDDLISGGSSADSTALAKVNGDGYSAYYKNREPGTAYTLAALASNKSGQQILSISSVRTRTTTDENCWISFSLSSLAADSFTRKISLLSGLDAVSGKFYYAPLDEFNSRYSANEYEKAIRENGTDLTAAQIEELCTKGYTQISVTGLQSTTTYFNGVLLTNSCGDSTIKTATNTKTR